MLQAVCIDLVFTLFVIKNAIKLADHAERALVLLQLLVIVVESTDWKVLVLGLIDWHTDALTPTESWSPDRELFAVIFHET